LLVLSSMLWRFCVCYHFWTTMAFGWPCWFRLWRGGLHLACATGRLKRPRCVDRPLSCGKKGSILNGLHHHRASVSLFLKILGNLIWNNMFWAVWSPLSFHCCQRLSGPMKYWPLLMICPLFCRVEQRRSKVYHSFGTSIRTLGVRALLQLGLLLENLCIGTLPQPWTLLWKVGIKAAIIICLMLTTACKASRNFEMYLNA